MTMLYRLSTIQYIAVRTQIVHDIYHSEFSCERMKSWGTGLVDGGGVQVSRSVSSGNLKRRGQWCICALLRCIHMPGTGVL